MPICPRGTGFAQDGNSGEDGFQMGPELFRGAELGIEGIVRLPRKLSTTFVIW